MSSFPFGWVRDFDGENWQLFWNSTTKEFYAKSAKSKRSLNLNNVRTWQDAKLFSDKVIQVPCSNIIKK